MKEILTYNCLELVLEALQQIDCKQSVAYAGNGRFIPILNVALHKRNCKTQINYYVDFDSSNWGKDVSELFPSEYFERFLSDEQKQKMYVSNPYEIIIKEDIFYIIQAIEGYEIKKKLLEAGVKEENIAMFNQGSREMLHQSGIATKLIKDKKPMSLKEMQKIELNILKEFHCFCKENKLTYYLSSGSLLGAIRHKGFIPWDDDIDVYMPYSDYLKFMEIYPRNCRYSAVCWQRDDNYFLTFGKLYDTNTILLHPGFPICGIMGVYIDIFPLAEYPNDERKEMFWEKNPKLEAEWMDCLVTRDLLGDQALDIRKEIMEKRYPKVQKGSQFVGARHYLSYVKPWCVRKEIYKTVVGVQFEDFIADAPVGWDELLKIRYGDYMKLPPKEKQVTHLFEAYMEE